MSEGRSASDAAPGRDLPDGPQRPDAIDARRGPTVVAVAGAGSGDDGSVQIDDTGIDHPVYVYPAEHYPFWTTVRMQAGERAPLGWGAFGERITLHGLLEPQLWVGDWLEFGGLTLRVAAPRMPDPAFDALLGFHWASRMLEQSGFCGAFCHVVHPGKVAAGTAVGVRAGSRVVTIAEAFRVRQRSSRGGPN